MTTSHLSCVQARSTEPAKGGGKRLRTIVLCLIAAFTMSAVAATAAQAKRAKHSNRANAACQIHGTLLEGEITELESFAVHGNTEVAVFEHPIFFEGNLSGVGIAEERNVFHPQSNTAVVQAKIAFTGTATCEDGRVLGTGGLEINFNARANFVTNSFTGHFEVIGSSGELAGTHGHGTATGEPGVPGGNGPYEGTLH